jgi:outer membrane protein assembly factor BamB
MRPLLLLALLSACATSVGGRVYLDRNRDRIRQHDEPGIPGVVVTLDRTTSARTGPDGSFRLDASSDQGIVWVRVPDGYKPGPVWVRADEIGTGVDLPLTPLTATELEAPLTFVVAADTHTTAVGQPAENGNWDGGDLDDALAQAMGLAQPPRFFTIVGDVTQANGEGEFSRVEEALAKLPVPWVPVPGNHDWYDGGVVWRKRWGPDNYSFDAGNLHVVIWDTNLSEEDQIAFFANDLAFVDPTQVVVALGHASPTDAVADQMADLGVDYVFTGHWHANRRVERTGLVEWGTQTMIMGSIDQSPSGYRVVTFVDGVPTVEHRARVTEPHLAVSSPHAGSCTSNAAPLLVSAAIDASLPSVKARIDCGDEIELSSLGGWSFRAALPQLSPGAHSIDVIATGARGQEIEKRIEFAVCAPPTQVFVGADWPQLGGSAAHTGFAPKTIAPPIVQQWAIGLGGSIVLGTPVIKGSTVVVGIWDLGAGDRGGLVALDLATGAEKWRVTTPYAVRAAPAIGTAGTEELVVAALENGVLRAFRLADGGEVWSYDVAAGVDSLASSLWAPPTIAGEVVYAAVQGRMAAVSLVDGQPVWTQELTPSYAWLGSLAAVAVGGDTAVANVSRNDGMTAWSLATGDMRWRLASGKTTAINATPLIDGDALYYIAANGTVTRSSLASSSERWSRQLTPGANEWSYAITAAPALGGGRLFVPTQYKDLVALDAATGTELWRRAATKGPLNFAHYRAAEPGFVASPVVTGNVVWIPHPDGTLAAVEGATGVELWKTSLGAPIVSAPAPAGDYLVVATFDGVVRAFVPAPATTPSPLPACEPAAATVLETDDMAAAGCCDAGSSNALLLGFAVAIPLARRRRRATS